MIENGKTPFFIFIIYIYYIGVLLFDHKQQITMN